MAGWSDKVIRMAGIAATKVGLDNAGRKFILRQIPNALYDAEGRRSDEPSSKSPRLTNHDLERFMAILEDRAGGKLDRWPPGYWAGKLAAQSKSSGERMAGKIHALYARYESCRDGGRYTLPGLCYKFSAERTSCPEDLRPQEAWNLIEMLKALVDRLEKAEVKQKIKARQMNMFPGMDAPLAVNDTRHHPAATDARQAVASRATGPAWETMSEDEIPF